MSTGCQEYILVSRKLDSTGDRTQGLLVISQVFWLNYGAQGLRLPEVTDDLFDSCN